MANRLSDSPVSPYSADSSIRISDIPPRHIQQLDEMLTGAIRVKQRA